MIITAIFMNTGLLQISECCKNFITKPKYHFFRFMFVKLILIQLFVKFINFKKDDQKKLLK